MGQGARHDSEHPRSRGLHVFSGIFPARAGCGARAHSQASGKRLSPFRGAREAVLGVFAFVWGQVTASFPDFGAWAASRLRRRCRAFSKGPRLECGKSSTGLVDSSRLGAGKSSAGSGSPMRARGRYARIPRSRTPRQAGRPAGNGGSDMAAFPPGTVPRECLGAGSAAGVSPAALGERALWAARLRMALCGRPAGGLGTGGSGRAVLGRTAPAVHSSGRFRRLLQGALGKLRQGRTPGRLLPRRPFGPGLPGRSRSSPPYGRPT